MPALNKIISGMLTLALACACSTAKCPAYDAGPTIYQYGPGKTYSRALAAKGNKLFIGNSDGYVYRLNLRNGKARRLSDQALPELRDIAITGCRQLIAMQSADTSRLTRLKGNSQKIFAVSGHPVFLDGMDILPSGKGFLMGDPVDGFFSLYSTSDGGKTWTLLPLLQAEEGEAGFAASGSNVQCLDGSAFVFVSGGMQSRFFRSADAGHTWTSVKLPFPGSHGSGPFSVYFSNEQDGVVVGGDYTRPDEATNNCYYTRDGGVTWKAAEKPPSGYRSCVTAWKGDLFACGTNGIDKSEDGGITWGRYASGNFMALAVARGKLYASMPDGQIREFGE